MRTAAVKIKNTYGQVNGYFHAQSGTCPASLPSWPCRFDPGHPLHRKSLTQQGFSRADGRRVLLNRGPCVPSVAVCTTPVPRRHDGYDPGKLAMPMRSRHPLRRKPLLCKGFHAADGLRVLLKRRSWIPGGAVRTTPLRQPQPGKLAMPVRSRPTRRTRPTSGVGSFDPPRPELKRASRIEQLA